MVRKTGKAGKSATAQSAGKKVQDKPVNLVLPGRGPVKIMTSEALALIHNANRQHQYAQALTLAEQLLEQQPRRMEAWLESFSSYHAIGDMSALESKARQCLEVKPRFVPALVNLGIALRLQQQHGPALEAIEKALKQAPGDAGIHNHRGVTLKEMGRNEEALASFERCLAIQPNHTGVIWNRSDLVGVLDEAEYQRLNGLADSATVQAEDRVKLRYALARSDERAGRYEAQFNQVQQGATLKRSLINYDHQAEIGQIESIAAAFAEASTIEAFADTPVPIFVCGLPRSGTTLVEQILSSHSLVEAGDELNDLPLATGQVLQKKGIRKPFPQWAGDLTESDWQALGEGYLTRTKALQSGGYFTDKNLQNYKAIGVIRRALPQAKIIICRRNPMDNLWGCYRQYFADGLQFTYDLNELADTWNASEKLVQHWLKTEPGIHLFEYEVLIDKPEETVRSLLDYLGLPWEDSCLNFHQNKRAVRTTSATQVRKPLNRSGMDVWKRYDEQLAGLKARLNQPAM